MKETQKIYSCNYEPISVKIEENLGAPGHQNLKLSKKSKRPKGRGQTPKIWGDLSPSQSQNLYFEY